MGAEKKAHNYALHHVTKECPAKVAIIISYHVYDL